MLAGLSPGRSMANVLQGHVPWYRYAAGEQPFKPVGKMPTSKTDPNSNGPPWEIGWHYSTLNLPMYRDGCIGCRIYNAGFGFNFGRRISRSFWFDSEFNFFPSAKGEQEKGGARQGLFGLKYGMRKENWGIFLKMRPGFVYYKKALLELDRPDLGSLTRFALDVGTIVEYYPSRHSALRLDIGSTLVRYLKGNVDTGLLLPVLSTKYFITQGNLQLGVSYVLRF
jgi:hypothetical protein